MGKFIDLIMLVMTGGREAPKRSSGASWPRPASRYARHPNPLPLLGGRGRTNRQLRDSAMKRASLQVGVISLLALSVLADAVPAAAADAPKLDIPKGWRTEDVPYPPPWARQLPCAATSRSGSPPAGSTPRVRSSGPIRCSTGSKATSWRAATTWRSALRLRRRALPRRVRPREDQDRHQ